MQQSKEKHRRNNMWGGHGKSQHQKDFGAKAEPGKTAFNDRSYRRDDIDYVATHFLFILALIFSDAVVVRSLSLYMQKTCHKDV
jgi:hypothetical protein